ncbi:5-formyltetrahydrofolate cyclo-ligase [Moraxella canis]|uniref:5-formyltetrahydrofolate cyclo-ligase n=1 Tax=Moraxella canis TaxID=90239 RepID=A0ABZ0WY51_9GAMM|nr:5-formyltetrahydrofolate cyclo-ligase [Moraxella canis]WQE04179.1 5-formyltetrahydrofolate cyclo-ligase [Moraxella canis]
MTKTDCHADFSPMDLRKRMRTQRRSLSQAKRYQSAFLAARFLYQLIPLLPKNANIGVYLDGFGELPTFAIAKFCQKLGYQAYLPITTPNKPLKFAPIMGSISKTPLKKHRLGMYEPVSRLTLSANHMDAIICPLVAVDLEGVRLGMGGGYYDRTFAKTKNCLKIAWCYEFQVVDQLPKQPWDMSVDLIITDQRLIRLK